MKRIFSQSNLLLATALVTFVGGLGNLLIPLQWVGSFIPSIDASGAFISRFTGVLLLGASVIALLARDLNDKKALRAIFSGFIVMNIGSLILAAYGLSAGMMGREGFADLVIHGSLAGSFAYLYVRQGFTPRVRPSSDQTSAAPASRPDC